MRKNIKNAFIAAGMVFVTVIGFTVLGVMIYTFQRLGILPYWM